jgi:general secretion pathway protein L
MATNEWLLLRLAAQDDAPISWAAADESGQLLALPSAEQDPALRALRAGRRIALLVPSGDVSHFEVQLPPGNEARLLQLAPFALEDQVSEDLEDLHFAVGPRDSHSGSVAVAVASRERMAHWLGRAAALQLTPAALYAESELVPALPGHVTMLVADDQLLLRQEGARTQVLPAADPAVALEMLLGPDVPLAGVQLMVHASQEDWKRSGAVIESLRERVASLNVQLESGGLLALYARVLAHARPINLLQGAFRPVQSDAGRWQRWRGAAIALLALLVLHGAGSGWELHRVHAEAAQLDKSMSELFGRVFPGQRPGSDPHGQFEERLREINGGAVQKGEFLPMMAALAAAQQNVPVARVDSFAYKPGSMQLSLSAPDADALEQYSQALRAGGYGVEILSGKSQGNGYSGQLSVKAGGS